MFEGMKARKSLSQVSPALQALDADLAKVANVSDPISRLVQFFEAVSTFNDKQEQTPVNVGVAATAFRKANDQGQYAQTVEALESLQTHFRQAGREPYGINRTQPGEHVTENNVYLGNVFGLWTFTASDWRAKLSRDDAQTKENKQIIEGQAAGFVKSHLEPMRKLIATVAAPKR